MVQKQISTDERYMRYALQLAEHGRGFTSPNPMVGAVIVAGGRIIGSGWHRCFGEGHAEVNAIASVAAADRHLLPEATIYVTLEPCSHYGKTPPCAQLLIHNRLRRVVIATPDPFAKVAGRGITMLREAGMQVDIGVLEEDALKLNKTFITAHTLKRPFIILKWARSADEFIAGLDSSDNPHATPLSDDMGRIAVHKLRADMDAIMVGANTVIIDNPRLDVRLWPARHNPLRISIDNRRRIPADALIKRDADCVIFTSGEPLPESIRRLYSEHGVTSLLVEGGTRLLQSMIDLDLYDEIRRETTPVTLSAGVKEPRLPLLPAPKITTCGKSTIEIFSR